MTQEHKEILGRIFTTYINIRMNPQSEYRKEAAEKLTAALNELNAYGISFDQLAAEQNCQQMLMLTDGGMQTFRNFVSLFESSGYDDAEDMRDITDEQIRIAKWVNEHRKELAV